VSLVRAVEVPRRPLYRLELIIGAARYGRVAGAADRLGQVLAGRTVWNVNTPHTAKGRLTGSGVTDRSTGNCGQAASLVLCWSQGHQPVQGEDRVRMAMMAWSTGWPGS
jgi:hypothetical protein